MDFNQVVARARAILTAPKTEWPLIAARPETVQSLYRDYFLLIAAIPAIVNFVQASIIGWHLPYAGVLRVGFLAGLVRMVLFYLGSLVIAYVLALVIDALAANFGGERNRVQALKTVVYSFTAAAVFSVASLIPFVGGFIAFAGSLYSLYLLYIGLPITMKAPPEKALGYTGLVLLASFVIGLLFGVVAFGGARASMMGARDEVHFDKDSVLGKLEERAKKVEAASKDLDAAQKSGDEEAQKAALGQVVGALSGSDAVIESLEPDRIKTFLPDSLDGLQRSDSAAERNSAMGMQISTASATYSDGANKHLTVEITDMGNAKGFAALASWAQFEHEQESDHGFEKTYKSEGRMVHESWDRTSKDGEYSLVVSERFAVKVSGSADSIDALKSAALKVDLPGLEALKDYGVKKGG